MKNNKNFELEDLIGSEWINVNENTTHKLLNIYPTTGGTMIHFEGIDSDYNDNHVFCNFVDEDATDYSSYKRIQWNNCSFYKKSDRKNYYDTSEYSYETIQMKKL